MLSNVWFERGLLAACFILAGLSLYNDYRKLHSNVLPLLILLAGFAIVIIKEVFPESDTVLAILIGLTVFIAYAFNWHTGRQHISSCAHD